MEGFPEQWTLILRAVYPEGIFPTFASGRQDRGQVNFLNCRRPLHLARLGDVAQEESPTHKDGSARRAHFAAKDVIKSKPPG